MEKTKVAVIGLGSIAQLVHLPILNKLNNVKITAVAEINKNRLNTIADRFNIAEKYLDYKEMLEKCDAEAIIIATPTNTHKEVSINCLKSKRDILVEKPIARTFDEAKAIVDAGKKYKKRIMVGMNFRYRPDVMLLKSLVNSGEIGEPFYVKSGWIRRQSSTEKWFTNKTESGGGVIIDLGIVTLDLALWLLNYPPVQSVSAQNFYHLSKNVEDSSISFIRCKNSSVINIETSWSLHAASDTFSLHIFGTKGSASLNPFRVYKKIDDQFIDLTPSQSESHQNLYKKSYMNELKSFIGGISGLNPILSPGDESLSRMSIVEAMYKSAGHQKEISF